MKRRLGATTSDVASAITISNGSSVGESNHRELGAVSDIGVLTQMLTSSESSEEVQVEATRGFRRMLTDDKNPPVQEVLQAGVLPFFVKNLGKNNSTAMIFESAWVLTNITSTSSAAAVFGELAVDPLAELLIHNDPSVREQAVWCLANIAGEDVLYRDDILLTKNLIQRM
jgi:importin subunit alpha-1